MADKPNTMNPSSPSPERMDAIKHGVFELDDLITQSEVCCTTLGKLAELASPDHVKHSMLWVQTDLGAAIIQMRRIFNELHVAMGGRAS